MISPRIVSITSLLALGAGSIAAPIPAQPIGLLDKKFATSNVEQDDFCVIQGPTKSSTVNKLLFTAKVKDLKGGKEKRVLYSQDIEPPNSPGERLYKIDKNAPIKPIGNFVVAAGTKFDEFIKSTDTSGDSRKPRYRQLFFHIPGVGLCVTEGGKSAVRIRSENPKDPTTAIKGLALRLSDFRSNNLDEEFQSRLFFGAKDASKGAEPFISAGSSKTSKILADINETKKTGSDPDQFATFGPQNETQKVFFVAKSPDDGGTYQLWQVKQDVEQNKATYRAVIFTTGSSALPGKPENLIANGADLFFTAPITPGGVPELWHLAAATTVTPNDLEVLTSGGRAPQNLTFTTVDKSYSELTMTVLDSGTRTYARWSHSANTVSILPFVENEAVLDPKLITDSGQDFYFANNFQGTYYLVQHSLTDNSLRYITSAGEYPYNITEICAVSSDGSAGVVYFTADCEIGAAFETNVLFRMDANNGSTTASPVRTETNQLVHGAKNLHPVISAGGIGVFRLYFSAPVSPTLNAEFLPEKFADVDLGTKPWVVAEE